MYLCKGTRRKMCIISLLNYNFTIKCLVIFIGKQHFKQFSSSGTYF